MLHEDLAESQNTGSRPHIDCLTLLAVSMLLNPLPGFPACAQLQVNKERYLSCACACAVSDVARAFLLSLVSVRHNVALVRPLCQLNHLVHPDCQDSWTRFI